MRGDLRRRGNPRGRTARPGVGARRAFSCSSAKYAERCPMASMIAQQPAQHRQRRRGCAPRPPAAAAAASASACAPAHRACARSAEPRSSSSRRAARRALAESGVRQRLDASAASSRLRIPEAAEIDLHAPRSASAVPLNTTAVKCAADARAMARRARRSSDGPVGAPIASAMRSRVSVVRRQRVRLRVGEHLQAVLQAAQEQRRRPRSSCTACGGSSCRRRAAAAPASSEGVCSRRIAAAADQLERLHDELDLADAAGAELDVVGELAPRDFALDQRLHLAQASNTP